jgi:hypothetical protein
VVFCDRAPLLFSDLDDATNWDPVIDGEPSLGQPLSAAKLDEDLAANGEFAELKSPCGLATQPGWASWLLRRPESRAFAPKT